MKKKIKIALIADEVTTLGMSPDANLIILTPINYRVKIQLFKPDLLFVESAWRGYNNSWKKRIVDLNKSGSNELINLVKYCKKFNIPTVFWNKEDPLHFERFKYAAKLFDYIYTTDINSVMKYKVINGGNFKFVNVLLFASQPKFHFKSIEKRRNGVVFLGGYYKDEIPRRSYEQLKLLTSIKDHNLIIYDRFYTNKNTPSFPVELYQYCKHSIPIKKCYDVYKQYQCYLNFNSISDSSTMLSRRVFELAACHSPILSTPSLAIETIFQNKVKVIIEDENINESIEYCIESSEMKKNTKDLYHLVMDKHTWQHRIQQIISDIF